MSGLNLGIYDPIKKTLIDAQGVSLHLNPYETKVFVFYIYGDKVLPNSVINITGTITDLTESNDLSLSFTTTNDKKYWVKSDTIYTSTGVASYPIHMKIANKHYTELKSELVIDISLFSEVMITVDTLSYYGDLVSKGAYKVLSKPVETSSTRTIKIDPRKDGVTDDLLTYSHGDSLVLLDDQSGILCTKAEPVTVQSTNSILKDDAGFYMWDDEELVDWDGEKE